MTSHNITYDGFIGYSVTMPAMSACWSGIDLSPLKEMIVHVGRNLPRSHRADLALAVFRRNVALHPNFAERL